MGRPSIIDKRKKVINTINQRIYSNTYMVQNLVRPKDLGITVQPTDMSNQLSSTRTAVETIKTGMLLAKGVSLKDIFDPNAKRETKSEVAKDFYRVFYTPGNYKEMVDVCLNISNAFLENINKAFTYDKLTNIEDFLEKNVDTICMARMAFDLTQEVEKLLKLDGCVNSKEISKNDIEKINQNLNKIQIANELAESAMNVYSLPVKTYEDISHSQTNFVKTFEGIYKFKLIKNQFEKRKDRSFSDIYENKEDLNLSQEERNKKEKDSISNELVNEGGNLGTGITTNVNKWENGPDMYSIFGGVSSQQNSEEQGKTIKEFALHLMKNADNLSIKKDENNSFELHYKVGRVDVLKSREDSAYVNDAYLNSINYRVHDEEPEVSFKDMADRLPGLKSVIRGSSAEFDAIDTLMQQMGEMNEAQRKMQMPKLLKLADNYLQRKTPNDVVSSKESDYAKNRIAFVRELYSFASFHTKELEKTVNELKDVNKKYVRKTQKLQECGIEEKEKTLKETTIDPEELAKDIEVIEKINKEYGDNPKFGEMIEKVAFNMDVYSFMHFKESLTPKEQVEKIKNHPSMVLENSRRHIGMNEKQMKLLTEVENRHHEKVIQKKNEHLENERNMDKQNGGKEFKMQLPG